MRLICRANGKKYAITALFPLLRPFSQIPVTMIIIADTLLAVVLQKLDAPFHH
jgi:hypothetical protein